MVRVSGVVCVRDDHCVVVYVTENDSDPITSLTITIQRHPTLGTAPPAVRSVRRPPEQFTGFLSPSSRHGVSRISHVRE